MKRLLLAALASLALATPASAACDWNATCYMSAQINSHEDVKMPNVDGYSTRWTIMMITNDSDREVVNVMWKCEYSKMKKMPATISSGWQYTYTNIELVETGRIQPHSKTTDRFVSSLYEPGDTATCKPIRADLKKKTEGSASSALYTSLSLAAVGMSVDVTKIDPKPFAECFKSQGVTEADLKTITSTGKRNPRVTSCLDKLVRNP